MSTTIRQQFSKLYSTFAQPSLGLLFSFLHNFHMNFSWGIHTIIILFLKELYFRGNKTEVISLTILFTMYIQFLMHVSSSDIKSHGIWIIKLCILNTILLSLSLNLTFCLPKVQKFEKQTWLVHFTFCSSLLLKDQIVILVMVSTSVDSFYKLRVRNSVLKIGFYKREILSLKPGKL